MMTEQELIRKIKGLKSIRPSEEWLDSTRRNLISRILLIKTSQIETGPRFGFFDWLKTLQPIGLTACLIFILFVGSWLAVKASQNSLPGEALYSIKKATERIQTNVTSGESQVRLQVEFAQRRLEELDKLTEDSLSAEEKIEKTEQIADDFKNNLAGASLYIKEVPKEKAQAVVKQTEKIKENLTRTKETVSLAVKEKLNEAEKLVEEINHQILATLAEDENNKKDNQTAASSTDQETLIFLEDKLNLETITTTKEIIK